MPNPCLLRDWTDSRKVNALSAGAERLFVRLMMKCDDYGRIPNDTLLLRSALFPLLVGHIREADISRWIAECAHAGLVRSYVAANCRSYLEVLNFGQRKKWMKSEHPPPEGQIGLPLPEKKPAACRSRSRSRGEERNGEPSPLEPEHNGHSPPLLGIKDGEIKKRETWQLLADEKALTDRIKQEAAGTNPDKLLIAGLKEEREQVRAEMRIKSEQKVA